MKTSFNVTMGSPLAEAPLAGTLPGVKQNGDSFVTDWQLPDPRRVKESSPVHSGRNSIEYLQAAAEASQAVALKARQPHSEFALMPLAVSPRLAAAVVAVMVVLGTLLWIGCRAMDGASSAASSHADSLHSEMAK
jgi:hypothetical protein